MAPLHSVDSASFELPPLVSFVVTSYTVNRFSDICDLLISIQKQTYENFEVILVIEKSTQLLKKINAFILAQKITKIIVTFNSGEEGLSAARNVGIKLASGIFLIFVDDDVTIPPIYVEETIKTYFYGDDVIGVTGLISPNWLEGFPDFFPEEFDWIFSCSHWFPTKEIVKMRNVFGTNFSFKREAFEKCGLFNMKYGFPTGSFEGFLGEDNEISLRIKRETGKSILYNPRIEVFHKIHKYRFQWRFIFRRAYNMGRSRRYMKNLSRNQEDSSLDVESSLLKRIITKLPSNLMGEFYNAPIRCLKTLSVTIVIISLIGLGYARGVKRPRSLLSNKGPKNILRI